MGDVRRDSSSKGENLLAIPAEERAKVLALIGARTIYGVAAQGRFDPRQSDFYRSMLSATFMDPGTQP
jgi:hypothetical protein